MSLFVVRDEDLEAEESGSEGEIHANIQITPA